MPERSGVESLTIRLKRPSPFAHDLDNEESVFSAKQRKLESVRLNTEDRIKIARDAIMIWAQSHRDLGAGIAVPRPVDVGSSGPGLAKKVVPLP